MSEQLQSVEFSQKVDGSWQAVHGPSGRVTHGLNREEAQQEMQTLLGMDESGDFNEPKTSDQFEGVAYDIAVYLEGPISDMLALHSGYARLEAYQEAVAIIRLGGGCQGCPSSRITLMNSVFRDLQERFGDDVIADVQPVLD